MENTKPKITLTPAGLGPHGEEYNVSVTITCHGIVMRSKEALPVSGVAVPHTIKYQLEQLQSACQEFEEILQKYAVEVKQ